MDLARLDLKGDRLERRERVTAALAELARRSQARLLPFLEEAREQGLIRSWQGFTIVNRLLVEATPSGIEALAGRPEVAAVTLEMELPEPALMGSPHPQPLSQPHTRTPGRGGPVTSSLVPIHLRFALPPLRLMDGATDGEEAAGATLPSPGGPGVRLGEGPGVRASWAIDAINAPSAWSRGLDGTGVVVGIIDSGASAVHEQLAAGFLGGEVSWLDPDGGSAEPRDTRFGHGTGVLSVAVGRNAAGMTLGIAPGAQWIACAALPRGRYNNVLATRCADWMLNVGRPDVIVAAWVLPTPGCDRSLQPIVDAWRAAGILPVFPAGNYGPGERTDRSPGNYETSLSVGGLTREGGPSEETSRGPSSCGGGAFPRLSAPAEELIAAFPLSRSTYLTAKGTSFAAGIAGGAAAILIQRHPDALIPELEEALGSGPLDLPGALERLDRIRSRRISRASSSR